MITKKKYSKVNSWTHFDPLKQVVIGNIYDPKFFDDLPDTSIRDSIQKVMYETIEDLNIIKKKLTDLGVEVIQTDSKWTQNGNILKENSFMEWQENNPNGSLPKPMINPRDNYITMGDEIFLTDGFSLHCKETGEHPLDMFDCNITLCKDMFSNYVLNKIHDVPTMLGPFTPQLEGQFEDGVPNSWEPSWDVQEYFEANIKKHPIEFSKFLWSTWQMSAASLTRLGDKLIVDEVDKSGFFDWYTKQRPDTKYKKVTCAIGGHNDGSMCLVRPGLIIGSPWMKEDFFNKTFPGWDCMIINDPNDFASTKDYAKLVEDQYNRKIKKKERINWFVKEKMHDHKFVKFVDQWLYDWVGMQDETLFEVNMLSLDEKNILTLNYQTEVHDKLKSANVNPIYVPFRHKRFWDSGLHCLTLDTYREGECREIN